MSQSRNLQCLCASVTFRIDRHSAIARDTSFHAPRLYQIHSAYLFASSLAVNFLNSSTFVSGKKMVVQAKESFVDLYGQIKRNALSKSFAGSSTVMILCHPDVDSLCSLRILVVRVEALFFRKFWNQTQLHLKSALFLQLQTWRTQRMQFRKQNL